MIFMMWLDGYQVLLISTKCNRHRFWLVWTIKIMLLDAKSRWQRQVAPPAVIVEWNVIRWTMYRYSSFMNVDIFITHSCASSLIAWMEINSIECKLLAIFTFISRLCFHCLPFNLLWLFDVWPVKMWNSWNSNGDKN